MMKILDFERLGLDPTVVENITSQLAAQTDRQRALSLAWLVFVGTGLSLEERREALSRLIAQTEDAPLPKEVVGEQTLHGVLTRYLAEQERLLSDFLNPKRGGVYQMSSSFFDRRIGEPVWRTDITPYRSLRDAKNAYITEDSCDADGLRIELVYPLSARCIRVSYLEDANTVMNVEDRFTETSPVACIEEFFIMMKPPIAPPFSRGQLLFLAPSVAFSPELHTGALVFEERAACYFASKSGKIMRTSAPRRLFEARPLELSEGGVLTPVSLFLTGGLTLDELLSAYDTLHRRLELSPLPMPLREYL